MEELKLKIVLVDNNTTELTSFIASVERALPGTKVVSVTSDLAGIEIAKTTDPDVIVIDVSLVEDHGLEISQIVKKEVALQTTPMLFISDLETDQHIRMNALAVGAEAFLNKPFDDAILITQLKAMAKIKERNMLVKIRTEQLETLVEIRTMELKQEISKYNLSEIELLENQNKFKAYIEKAPVGIIVVDNFGRKIDVNEKTCQLTGYSKDEILNLSIEDHFIAKDLPKVFAEFRKLKNDGFAEGEFRSKNKDGQTCWIALSGSKINDNSFIVFHSDISERKEHEQRIEYLSYHDSLTDVNNRAFFEDEIARLDTISQLPLSVINADVNGLKMINDALGHAAGDNVLKEAARAIRSCTRETDILARVGGDEFSVILPQTDCEEVKIIVEQLQLACNETIINVGGNKILLSISLGYATKTEIAEPVANTLMTAEDFMYRRKLLVRDSFHSSLLQLMRTSLFERSNETEEHAARLVVLTGKLGKAMGLNEEKLNELQLFSTLHDIGKISIDNSILTKAGPLTDIEFLEMKKHSGIGYRIAMASPDFKSVAEYILCHHERWDGKGYPQGISEEEIPLLSRILSVVDAYDAMTSDRSYRKATTTENAIAEIENNSGTQFDPQIANLFAKIMRSPNLL